MKFWKFLNSKTTFLPIGIFSIGLLIVGAASMSSFNLILDYTNTTEFCVSCHEMKSTVYPEYQQSIHYQNASGVRVGCADCHVSQEFIPKIIRKVQASNEVYHKLLGTIDTPEKFEARRLTLAKRVWESMEANDSRECRSCHSFEAMHFERQKPEAAKEMQKAMAEGDTCISCHKGIAHKLPDMSSGYKTLYQDIMTQASHEGAASDILYTVGEIPFYLNKDEVGQRKSAGKILSASKLVLLERSGDARKIRLEGWRQKGAERVVYELMGHRIFVATISSGALDQVKIGEEKIDLDTELTWMPVSLEGWVHADQLISDRNMLWNYAAEMYSASCSTCHGKPDPHHYLANQWIGVIKSMSRFVSLNKQEIRLLQKYLQLHASDTSEKEH